MHNADHSRIQLPLADEQATAALGAQLARALSPGLVVYLHGDLGAGKTTLVRAVLRALGYGGRVKSPTYALLETYHAGGLDLCHFDLYRMKDASEWESGGFRDLLDGSAVHFIEWPEKAATQLPGADLEIQLSIEGDQRHATLHAQGDAGCACLDRLALP